MADKKISELTSLAQGSIDADADVVAIVDTSATETKKATAEAVVLAALSQASAVTIPGTATINSTVIPNNKTLLVSTDIGSTVQAYDADTAKYDDVTANFTGTLQNGGSNVLVDTDIGTNVQAYDADTAKYDDTTANFTGTLQNGGSNVLVDTDIGTNVQAYDADTAKYDDVTANFTGTLQNGGSNVLVDTDIGTNVQAYDADTAKYDDVTANFTGTLQNGGSNVVVDTDIGSSVLAYDSNLQSFVTAFTLPTVDGSADQVLKTDGAGNIGFASVTTSAAGSDTQIQYNSSGSFAGASGLVTDGSNLTVNAQGDIRFADSDSSNWIALQAPATVATNVTFTLPNADGTSGQALTTDGSGALSWATVAGSPGGSDTQLQYNSSGSFAGASGLVTDGSNLTINAQGDLRFADSDSSNWVAFQAPATVASNVTWTLPDADGTDGQVMKTNGSGTLSWITPASGGGGGGTSVTVTQVTATASQTDFSVTYTVGQLSVYLNGALLASADYTATNGTTVVLASGAASGDIFTAVAYDSATQITQGDSSVVVTDSGTGKVEVTVDNVEVADFTTGAIVFNETGANQDFRVEGDTNANLIVADAGVDKVGIGTNTFNTNGGVLQVSNGISFPATQSACSDANTLDDYEEGTWTPTAGGSLTVVGTFSSNGKYTKVGRLVTVSGQISATTSLTLTANQQVVDGLPFNNTAHGAGGGFTSGSNTALAFVDQAGPTQIYASASSGPSSIFYFSLTYFAS